jgi:hypothetical protein
MRRDRTKGKRAQRAAEGPRRMAEVSQSAAVTARSPKGDVGSSERRAPYDPWDFFNVLLLFN